MGEHASQAGGDGPVEAERVGAVETERVAPVQAERIGSVDVEPAESVVSLLPYQRRIVESDARFTWSCWARQTGKSFTLSLRRVLRALERGRTQLFLSAGMRQSKEMMVKVQQHCQALRLCMQPETGDGAQGAPAGTTQLPLPNGARLIALPARPETVRGFTGDVFLDEFAMHADDRAIWAAMFPTILRGGGELDVASTPKGRAGLFYQLQENPSFERSIVTLPEAIEQGLAVDVDEVRRAMGDEELFRQEFLCEFLDESEAFLTHAAIAACEDPQVEAEPDWAALQAATGDVYAGVDVARKRDLTAIWLWGWHAPAAGASWRGQWWLRCAGLIELRNAPFRRQQEELARVLDLRCVRRCCIDATGMGFALAEWAQERYGPRVEPVVFTQGLKAQMAGQLRRLIEETRVRIPAAEAIRNDWHSVRRSVTAGGGLRLDAARGDDGHADRFWAAALGVHAVEGAPTGALEYATTGPLRFARDGTW